MTITQIKKYFGDGAKACRAIGIERQNFYHWKKNGWIPSVCQMKFEKITKGDLKAEF